MMVIYSNILSSISINYEYILRWFICHWYENLIDTTIPFQSKLGS